MNRTLLMILLAAGLLSQGAVFAEGPDPQPAAEGKPALKPQAVPAVPEPKMVEQDTEEAATQIEERQKADELIRKTVREPERRPDLDHTVVQGIQALNVEKALRRR